MRFACERSVRYTRGVPGSRTRGALALALLALGCVEAGLGDERPRGVVLIVAEGLRADDHVASPVLARLAAEGVRFESVQSQSPSTVSAVASLWTGLYPRRHLAAGERGFADGIPTLPERMQAAGYRTHGRIASTALDMECFRRGFDRVEVAPAGPGDVVAWVQRTADQLGSGERFFLYLHFAHAQVEEEVGAVLRLLSERGLEDLTLVALTSDHGREIGPGDGDLSQALLAVPLLIRGPGVRPGHVVRARMRLMDVGTTLLEIAMREKSPAYLGSGRSLVPALRGEPLENPDPVLSESAGLAAIVTPEGMKLVHGAGVDRLFDLATDPDETRDLASTQPDVVERLTAELEAWFEVLDANAFDTDE